MTFFFDHLFIAVPFSLDPRFLNQGFSDLQGKSRMVGAKFLVDISVDNCVHVSGNKPQCHPPQLGGVVEICHHQ